MPTTLLRQLFGIQSAARLVTTLYRFGWRMLPCLFISIVLAWSVSPDLSSVRAQVRLPELFQPISPVSEEPLMAAAVLHGKNLQQRVLHSLTHSNWFRQTLPHASKGLQRKLISSHPLNSSTALLD